MVKRGVNLIQLLETPSNRDRKLQLTKELNNNIIKDKTVKILLIIDIPPLKNTTFFNLAFLKDVLCIVSQSEKYRFSHLCSNRVFGKHMLYHSCYSFFLCTPQRYSLLSQHLSHCPDTTLTLGWSELLLRQNI